MKKVISLLLCALLVFGVSIPVLAYEGEPQAQSIGISPRMAIIGDARSTLTKVNSTSVKATISIRGSQITSYEINVELQKKGLFGYSYHDSDSKSGNSNTASFSPSFTVSSGTYRVYTTFTAYNANGESETRTATSNEVTL